MNEIISALSFALDLTEGAVPGHAVRSCLYGMCLADHLALDQTERASLYYALLLKDVGCSSNAARMCEMIGGDDRQMKHDVKFLEWSRPSAAMAKLLWKQTLPDASVFERSGRLLKIALHQQKNNLEMIELRCDRGAAIARKIGFDDATSQAIRFLDEHWDGSGYPERRRGTQIPLLSRILLIAQHLDVFASEHGLAAAVEELQARSGRWFDPELVRVTRDLYNQGILQDAVGPFDHYARVIQLRPDSGDALAAEDIDRICEAFAEVVDAKSSFTYSHSLGVTRAADGIAAELGFSPERCRLIHQAALLHDLGKLSVSNTILDKPGKLDQDEWKIIRGHPALSEQILSRISHFDVIAKIAGQHHEKLDGSGYPLGLSDDDLSLDSRLVAVADIYGALSEDRPYRPGMETEKILTLLRGDIPHKLDPDCVEALERFLQSPSS